MSLFPPNLNIPIIFENEKKNSARSEKKSVTLVVPYNNFNQKIPPRIESLSGVKYQNDFKNAMILPSAR